MGFWLGLLIIIAVTWLILWAVGIVDAVIWLIGDLFMWFMAMMMCILLFLVGRRK